MKLIIITLLLVTIAFGDWVRVDSDYEATAGDSILVIDSAEIETSIGTLRLFQKGEK